MPKDAKGYPYIQRHYTREDGTEVDIREWEGEYGRPDRYGHRLRTETTETHPTGIERVTYEDIYGDEVRWIVQDPADGSVRDVYKDANGRWWQELGNPDGTYKLQTIDGVDPGEVPKDTSEYIGKWRDPEEGEEPHAWHSQEQSPGEDDALHAEQRAAEAERGKALIDDAKLQAQRAEEGERGKSLIDDAKQQAQRAAEGERGEQPPPPPPPPPPPEPPPPPGIVAAGGVPGTVARHPGVEGGDEEEQQQPPPVAQTPEAEPPVQPTPPGDVPDDVPLGGVPGLGVPYEDFIPLIPMVKDPATGQWRNAYESEGGYTPDPEGGEGDDIVPEYRTLPWLEGDGEEEEEEAAAPTSGRFLPGEWDEEVPPETTGEAGEIPLPPTEGRGQEFLDWLNREAAEPVEDLGPPPFLPEDLAQELWQKLSEPAEPEDQAAADDEPPGGEEGGVPRPGDGMGAENGVLPSNLLDPAAPGPTIDADLLDPSAPGPTLDSRVLDPASPGPSIDPALLDPLAPGPTLDPTLLDPTAPGPTVDPALLDPSAPGESIDPALLDPAAPGPTLGPAQLEQQGIAHPSGGGVAEPLAGVTEQQGFTDPSPTESGQPEPSTPPGDDLDDPSALG